MTVDELRKKMQNLVEDAVNSDLTAKIGSQVAKRVKDRTRKGWGVEDNGAAQKRLKPLKPVTKRIRKGLSQKGQLSSQTGPGRSNLTRSGKMLNNIKYKADDNKVIVSPQSSDRIKAQDVSVERPFMNLSKKEIRDVVKSVEEEINKDIRKKGL